MWLPVMLDVIGSNIVMNAIRDNLSNPFLFICEIIAIENKTIKNAYEYGGKNGFLERLYLNCPKLSNSVSKNGKFSDQAYLLKLNQARGSLRAI